VAEEWVEHQGKDDLADYDENLTRSFETSTFVRPVDRFADAMLLGCAIGQTYCTISRRRIRERLLSYLRACARDVSQLLDDQLLLGFSLGSPRQETVSLPSVRSMLERVIDPEGAELPHIDYRLTTSSNKPANFAGGIY